MSKKTLKTVIKSGNNAIIQIKNNQQKLLADCTKAAGQMPVSGSFVEPGKKKRNRIENRKVQIFENPQPYFTQEIKQVWGEYINTIIKVERERRKFDTHLKTWQTSHEITYYISTINLKKQKNLTAKEYAMAIRNHWGIENRNHNVKDTSMNEDKSRIRINPDRFARLRSFSLNILRVNKVKNIKNERYKNAMNFTRLFKYGWLLS